MTADSMDLEDCNTTCNEIIGSIILDDINIPVPLPLPDIDSSRLACSWPSGSWSDLKIPNYRGEDDVLYPEIAALSTPSDGLSEDPFADFLPSQNSSLYDSDFNYSKLVSPDLICPMPVVQNSILSSPLKEDSGDEAVDSIWPEVSQLNDLKLLKFVGGYLGDDLVPIDELFKKKKRRKLTHLDFDHCYSARPIQEENDEEEDEYDYFNSAPYSPASSSCSDKSKGVKRTRSKRKTVKQIKIKQEICSDEEEVDVETPCPISLVVPKITISLAPPPVKTGPAKRGRKPKNKTEAPVIKKSNNKNYPVSAKDLQAAIKQQKQKCYITKSGRVSNKISNSVETTPSTSTQSSMSNSRCNSDNEDTVDKRASHNMAERNRRQELTNLFQNVRKKVPAIEKNLKASKVLILQSAATYVENLEGIDKVKASQKQQLRAEIEKKLAIVQSLRNSRGCSS